MAQDNQIWRAMVRHRTSLFIAALAFVASQLLLFSWRAWADPYVDFPHELYIPWRLANGALLYRDVHHPYGPLTHYYHALLFWLFGPHMNVLLASNLLVIAALCSTLFGLFRRLGDAWTAGVVTIFFLAFFAFLQTGPMGGYNYMTPYAHETTHGTLLALTALLLLARAQEPHTLALRLLASLCAGLTILTKPEIALPTFTAIALQLLLARTPRRHLLLCGVATLVPFVAASALFARQVGWRDGIAYGGMAIASVLRFLAQDSGFYRTVTGLDDLAGNSAIAAQSLLAVVVLLAAVTALSHGLARWLGDSPWSRLLAAGLPAVALALLPVQLLVASYALPYLVSLGLLVALLRWRTIRAAIGPERHNLLLVLLLFALLYLLKIWARTMHTHFGFYLSMPATLVCVGYLLEVAPVLLALGPLQRTLFRWSVTGALLAYLCAALNLSQQVYSQRTAAVGPPAEHTLYYPEPLFGLGAAEFNAVLQVVERMVPKGATLLTLPCGEGVNYFTKRVNPTRIMPNLAIEPWFHEFGGAAALIRELREHPPEYVLYLHSMTDRAETEFIPRGPRGFANEVYDWIDAHYQPVVWDAADIHDFGKLRFVLMRRAADAP